MPGVYKVVSECQVFCLEVLALLSGCNSPCWSFLWNLALDLIPGCEPLRPLLYAMPPCSFEHDLSLSSAHWGKKYITISKVQGILYTLNFQGEKLLRDTNLQNLVAKSHLFHMIEIKPFLHIV